MFKKNTKWLYLPIETKVREFEGKSFLAFLAVLKGFNVVIGPKKYINSVVKFMPKGMIFNFGLADNFFKTSELFKKIGHIVINIDEEGLVTLNDKMYLDYRVSGNTLKFTNLFFCWGKKQASLINKKLDKDNNCKICIIGNPRFDILRPEFRFIFDEDVKKIRDKYGKFILINTNFGHANHFLGYDFAINSFKRKGFIKSLGDKNYYFRRMDWQKNVLNKFFELIPVLSENFKDYNIVIRPHPSENHDFWKSLEEKFNNVKVVHSGNVIPWLISASVLLHNNCTTAVESFVIGKPSIAYRPIIIDEMESFLPNELSFQAENMDNLIKLIKDRINNISFDSFYERKKEILSNYIESLSGQTASNRIVNELLKLKILDNSSNLLFGILKFKLFNFLLKIKNIFNILLKNNSYQLGSRYLNHKVPKIKKDELFLLFSKFNRNFKDDLSSIEIKKLFNSCYLIKKK